MNQPNHGEMIDCLACRPLSPEVGSGLGVVGHALKENRRLEEDLEEIEDCTTAFRRSTIYTHARIYRCTMCHRLWLRGYDEDFSGLPIEAEWGRRTWIMAPLTPDLIDEIHSARTGSLNLLTFGNPTKEVWNPPADRDD